MPIGDIDISFYRDDVGAKSPAAQPVVHASHIDFDLAGRTVVLVDDVLFTGRTVRAAIDALFDYGRPQRVQLAVLCDRGHRELPIRPDYVGKNLPTGREQRVNVHLEELDGGDEVTIADAQPAEVGGMRHLLSIEQLSKAEIEAILDRAESFAEVGRRDIKKVPTLRGRTVVTLFYEASTRTSSSFELAAKRLSADLVSVKAAGSSVDKGESLKDTVATLSAYDPAAIVLRHPYAGAAQLVAGWADAAVVNAGDGKHEHPSQALLDVYTLRRRLGSLEGKRIWIVGDVLHSRVARSNLIAFKAMGAELTVCGPPALIPRGLEQLGCEVEHSLERLGEADVVYALRLQRERMNESFVPSIREYAAHFQIDSRRLGPRQLLMHPGPVNRGVELSGEVIDSPQSLIAEQVASGLVVRMAILYELLAAGDEEPAPVAGNGQRRPRSDSRRERATAADARRGERGPGPARRHGARPGRRHRRPARHRRPRRRDRRAGRARRGQRRWPRGDRRRRPARLPGLLRPPRPPAHARPGAQGGHRDRRSLGSRRRLLRHPRDGQHRAAGLDPRRRRGAACRRPRRRRGQGRLPRHRDPRDGGRGADRDGLAARCRRRSASATTGCRSAAPGCCAGRCSTSGSAAARSPCTRRTRSSPAPA